jgi:hypothetical protein
VKLAFLCRHWFCENNADFFATVPEQRQNTARVPRGQSAADREWQLADPRIYTLIRGNPPSLTDLKSDREFQRALPKKTHEFKNVLKLEGKRLTALAREAEQCKEELYGVARGEPQTAYSDALNQLRASVALSRQSHGMNRWMALRIFELDRKNGDETPEEMPKLTVGELAELQGQDELTPAQLSEEERVRDMNKNDVKKYAWLMEQHAKQASLLVEAGKAADDATALEQVRRGFWQDGAPWKERGFQGVLPSQNLMRRVFFSLVVFKCVRMHASTHARTHAHTHTHTCTHTHARMPVPLPCFFLQIRRPRWCVHRPLPGPRGRA